MKKVIEIMAIKVTKNVLISCDENNPDFSGYSELSAFGAKCCENNQNLTSITIPNTVKEIRYGAFLGCNKLTACTIDSNNSQLSSIDGLAFYGCDQLTSISLPSRANHIDHYAFMHSGIRSATIPGKTVSALFPTEYTKITSITMANGAVVQPYQFSGCTLLLTNANNVTIPDDISSFLPHALHGFNGTLVANTSKYVFKGKWILNSKKDKNTVTFGDNNEIAIVGGAYEGDNKVETITIKEQIKNVGSRAFANCQYLKEVTISNNSTVIADDAFEGCPRLTCVTATQPMLNKGVKNSYPRSIENIKKVKIANQVTTIPEHAFDDLDLLSAIEFNSGQIQMIEPNALPMSQLTNLTTSNTNIVSLADWILDGSQYNGNPELVLGSSFHGIGPHAFSGNPVIQTLDLKNVIYYGKQSLADIDVDSVTFNRKTYQTLSQTAGFPWGLNELSCTFMGYNDTISHVLAYPKLKNITSETFSSYQSGISSVITLKIGSFCKKIDNNALSNYTSLETLDIGDNELSIGQNAFKGCTALKNIIMSNNAIIGNNAFQGCNELTSVIVKGQTYDKKDEWGNIDDSNMTVISFDVDGEKLTFMKKFQNVSLLSGSSDDYGRYPTTALDITYNEKTYSIKDAVEISLQPDICQLTDNAFINCTKLKKLIIKASMNSIKMSNDILLRCFNIQQLQFTNAKTITDVMNIKDTNENISHPWGYTGIIAHNVIDIVVIGT